MEEKIKEFLSITFYGNGDGSGCDSGDGSGYGNGYGWYGKRHAGFGPSQKNSN